MTDHVWETFDNLFKTVHRQARRVEELESRMAALELKLAERAAAAAPVGVNRGHVKPLPAGGELPIERAA